MSKRAQYQEGTDYLHVILKDGDEATFINVLIAVINRLDKLCLHSGIVDGPFAERINAGLEAIKSRPNRRPPKAYRLHNREME